MKNPVIIVALLLWILDAPNTKCVNFRHKLSQSNCHLKIFSHGLHLTLHSIKITPLCSSSISSKTYSHTSPQDLSTSEANCVRVQLKCDGTRWRTGGELKAKLANAVGSQYPSHYLGTWCIQHYYRWCAHLGLPVVDWTDAPRRFSG
jgi:hypothetical protein